MLKKFEVTHEGNHIRVENSWFHGERLYINGKLQDENIGLAFRATLNGKLNNDKEVKVTLGGNLSINCRIFVDHTMIYSNK
ncbi:hypothetical protein F9279_04480 [Bacillus sp. B1-b2]|nr:hypothetical protein F9279_04480 [Bacillus sp. B1-b2]